MGLGFKVLGLGFKVWGLDFEVSGLGFEVLGLGAEVLALGFEIMGLGFEVLGLGPGVLKCIGRNEKSLSLDLGIGLVSKCFFVSVTSTLKTTFQNKIKKQNN